MPGVPASSDGAPSSKYGMGHVVSEFSEPAPAALEAQRDTDSGDWPARSDRSPRRHPRIPRHRISILDSIFSYLSASPRKLQ